MFHVNAYMVINLSGSRVGSCCLTSTFLNAQLTTDHPTHSSNYLMESFHLDNVEYVNDLGITIDSHLIFHQLTLYTASGLINKANHA